MADRQLYGVRLGAAALLRGERLICEVLGVLAQNAAYARVRIVYSTLGDRGFQAGRERMVRRDSLVPVQAADRAVAAALGRRATAWPPLPRRPTGQRRSLAVR